MKPVLQTTRLKLVPFDPADLELLQQTLTDPFVRRYLMDDEIISLEKAKEFMLINEHEFLDKRWGLWKIISKETNAYAGIAGLWTFFEEDQPQLLYALLPDKIKQGYAFEASVAVIDYAFTILGFNYLKASCDTPNSDSRKVSERLNMVKTGEKEINGHPTTFYSLKKG